MWLIKDDQGNFLCKNHKDGGLYLCFINLHRPTDIEYYLCVYTEEQIALEKRADLDAFPRSYYTAPQGNRRFSFTIHQFMEIDWEQIYNKRL